MIIFIMDQTFILIALNYKSENLHFPISIYIRTEFAVVQIKPHIYGNTIMACIKKGEEMITSCI